MNMKRKILVLSAALLCGAALFSSCDQKMCYCYENGLEEEMYVNADQACSAYTSGNRGCVEVNERMNPSQTAYK